MISRNNENTIISKQLNENEFTKHVKILKKNRKKKNLLVHITTHFNY